MSDPLPAARVRNNPLSDLPSGTRYLNPFSVYPGRRRSDGKWFAVLSSDCDGQTLRFTITPADARWLIAHLKATLGTIEGYPAGILPKEPLTQRTRRWLRRFMDCIMPRRYLHE